MLGWERNEEKIYHGDFILGNIEVKRKKILLYISDYTQTKTLLS